MFKKLFLVLFFVPTLSIADFNIENAWVRKAPPMMKMTAGYMTITNNFNHDVTINEVTSPQFGKIEIHNVSNDNGVFKMFEIGQVTIKAKSSHTFKPRSYHFMMMQAQSSIPEMQSVSMTIKTSDGYKQTIMVPVK